jgi:coenzyme F420-reducing hydrogenase gamma subunit
MAKKLAIGWFSFSCCEDSSIVFTELLNDHFKDWVKVIDFQHVRILKKNNKLENLDVAFVEGAVASSNDARKVKEIRKNCKKLVAIGSCAVTGMPSAQRNLFDKERKKEIEFLIKKFHQAKKVKKLEEVIKVDAKVPGCPMSEKIFLETLNNCLKEFKII